MIQFEEVRAAFIAQHLDTYKSFLVELPILQLKDSTFSNITTKGLCIIPNSNFFKVFFANLPQIYSNLSIEKLVES